LGCNCTKPKNIISSIGFWQKAVCDKMEDESILYYKKALNLIKTAETVDQFREISGFAEISPPDDEVCMVVFGFGNLGESVVVQALKMGHYLGGTKIRIIVVDENAGTKGVIFNDRYKHAKDISDASVEFVDLDLDESGFFDSKRLWKDIRARPDIIYMCLDEDSMNISAAFHMNNIPAALAKPTIISISKDEGFALTLRSRVNTLLKTNKVHMYPSIQAACTKEIVLAERLDSIARAIHELSYLEREERAEGYKRSMKRGPKGSKEYKDLLEKYEQIKKNKSHVSWDKLNESYKDSNRQQAEHIEIKLRTLGYEMATDEDLKALKGKYTIVKTITDPNDKLAKMEHFRWNAERFMGGWKYGKTKTDITSPYLVSWEELTEEIRQYDRDAVLRIPKILSKARPRYYIIKRK